MLIDIVANWLSSYRFIARAWAAAGIDLFEEEKIGLDGIYPGDFLRNKYFRLYTKEH